MPELGPYGSVRGARGNSRPYRERTTLCAMSGLAPTAAVMLQCRDRSKSAKSCREQVQRTAVLFDQLVGDGEQSRRNSDPERPCSLHIDDQFELCWL
jgi:hypothetical protein